MKNSNKRKIISVRSKHGYKRKEITDSTKPLSNLARLQTDRPERESQLQPVQTTSPKRKRQLTPLKTARPSQLQPYPAEGYISDPETEFGDEQSEHVADMPNNLSRNQLKPLPSAVVGEESISTDMVEIQLLKPLSMT